MKITETRNIVKCGDLAVANGVKLDMNSIVSMNMWGFAPEFIDMLEKGFVDFFENEVPENPVKSEYLLPMFVEKLLQEKRVSVKILPTNEKWFGATYKEDIPYIRESFCKLTTAGVYKQELYSDIK